MDGARGDDGYRLHGLRRVRAAAEERATRVLAQATAAVDKARQVLAARREAHAAVRAREQAAAEAACTGGAISDLVTARRHAARIGGEVDRAAARMTEAEREVRIAAARVAAARDALGVAIRERKALDAHYEKHRDARDRQRRRREQD